MALRKWGQATPQVVGKDGWGDHECGGHGHGSFGGRHSGHALGCWWSRPAWSFFPPPPTLPQLLGQCWAALLSFHPMSLSSRARVGSDPRLPGNGITECVIVLLKTVGAAPWRNWCKKAKWLSEEALQMAVKRREVKSKEKRRDILSLMQSSTVTSLVAQLEKNLSAMWET